MKIEFIIFFSLFSNHPTHILYLHPGLPLLIHPQLSFKIKQLPQLKALLFIFIEDRSELDMNLPYEGGEALDIKCFLFFFIPEVVLHVKRILHLD